MKERSYFSDLGNWEDLRKAEENLLASREYAVDFQPLLGVSGGFLPLGRVINNQQAIDELSLSRKDIQGRLTPLTADELAEMTGFTRRSWLDGIPPKSRYESKIDYAKALLPIYVKAGQTAIDQALANAQMTSEEVDKWIVGSTAGPDGLSETLFPGKEAFYIRAACPAGGLFLHELWRNENKYLGKNILAVFPEIVTSGISPDVTRAIFGDVATNFVIRNYGEHFRVLHSEVTVLPDSEKILQIDPLYENPPAFHPDNPEKILQVTDRGMTVFYHPWESEYGIKMDGGKLIRWVDNGVLQTMYKFVDDYNLSHRDKQIDWVNMVVVSHQANGKMLRNFEKRLRRMIEKDHPDLVYASDGVRIPFVNEDTGNISGSSLLVALNRIVRDPQYVNFSDGQPKRLLVAGFGAGLVLAFSVVEFNP